MRFIYNNRSNNSNCHIEVNNFCSKPKTKSIEPKRNNKNKVSRKRDIKDYTPKSN